MTAVAPDAQSDTVSSPSSWQTVSSETELMKMWAIFPVENDQPVSIRALKPHGGNANLFPRNVTFTAREYPDVAARQQAFATEALALNARGYNVYTTVNPLSDFYEGRGAARDQDIACRARLLIDLDRFTTAGSPATDAEIEQALAVASNIADFLVEESGLTIRRTMSGNGAHLYVELDRLANNPEMRLDCHGMLLSLASRFDTPDIKVDTTVFNAGRITKIPGTIARKGVESEGRIFRAACVL